VSGAADASIRRLADLDDATRARLPDSGADPLYSALSARFYASYAGGRARDLSLVALRGADPVAFIPASALDSRASYYGMPARAFGEPSTALLRALADEAAAAGCVSLKLDSRAAAALAGDPRLGPANPTETAVVDLKLDVAALRAALRKSYKSLVNWGSRNLDMELIDQANAGRTPFLAFRDFHRAVSGRATRSDETWEIQFEMIRAGEAYAVLGRRDGRLVSASLIQHSSVQAYYGVGVYDRELMAQRVPVAHGTMFHAILHARQLGLSTFVLGDVGATGDEKADNIARFKRGFATAIEPSSWMEMRLP
jgi:hypothetical protein